MPGLPSGSFKFSPSAVRLPNKFLVGESVSCTGWPAFAAAVVVEGL